MEASPPRPPRQGGGLAFALVTLLGFVLGGTVDSARAQTTPECDTYVIQAGDTIWRIALSRGISMESVFERNDIADPRMLQIGTELCLPPSAGTAPLRSEAIGAEQRDAPSATESAPADRERPELRRPRLEAELEASLATAQTQFDAADFEGALATLADTRSRLELLAPGSRRLRAQVELQTGMVEVAFGRYEEAIASFQEAIRLDPELTLDAETSPKIVSVFWKAQSEPSAATPESRSAPRDDAPR